MSSFAPLYTYDTGCCFIANIHIVKHLRFVDMSYCHCLLLFIVIITVGVKVVTNYFDTLSSSCVLWIPARNMNSELFSSFRPHRVHGWHPITANGRDAQEEQNTAEGKRHFFYFFFWMYVALKGIWEEWKRESNRRIENLYYRVMHPVARTIKLQDKTFVRNNW
jgi:hypothetical protein